jgi:hypothetical protein
MHRIKLLGIDKYTRYFLVGTKSIKNAEKYNHFIY